MSRVRATAIWAFMGTSVIAQAGCGTDAGKGEPSSSAGSAGAGRAGSAGAPGGAGSGGLPGSGGSETGGASGGSLGVAGSSGLGGSAEQVAACAAPRGDVQNGALAFSSGVARYDAAYEKAKKVIAADVVDGAFIAGESWSQVWTRDTSYSIDLGAGLLEPEVALKTLKGMTGKSGSKSVWLQDAAGHFGGWPNLSDSIVGAVGAWSLYLTTGDQELLAWAYDVTVNSLARAENEVFLSDAGLFGGCSTFMESNSGYPKRYENTKTLLAKTKALSTNLLYYRGYVIAAEMAKLLGKDGAAHAAKASKLKAAIDSHLWLDNHGYYAYFEDENGQQQKTMEGAGEAFAILWDVADSQRAARILAESPTTAWGFPCLWPQFPEWKDYGAGFPLYYHNGMIWPFVQGYWGWAAAKAGAVDRFGVELDRITTLSEKSDTYREFYHPEDGKVDGSKGQLWSASGYLSFVYHGLFGMSFDPSGLTFAPVVPAAFTQITLDGVRYRGATLNVSVTGHGSKIAQTRIDGAVVPKAFVAGTLTGMHTIDIALSECAH